MPIEFRDFFKVIFDEFFALFSQYIFQCRFWGDTQCLLEMDSLIPQKDLKTLELVFLNDSVLVWRQVIE